MKTLLLITFFFISLISFSQTDTTYKIRTHKLSLKTNQLDMDTMIYSKVDKSIYFRMTPIATYTGGGLLKDKINQNIEVGMSYGMVDVGLAYGRYSLRDTTNYLEFKVTMDAAQYGILSSEFTLGAGYSFKNSTPLMLECSYTILAQIEENIGIGLVVGYYDFSGSQVDISKNMYGIILRWGLPRSDGGFLIANRRIKMHKAKR